MSDLINRKAAIDSLTEIIINLKNVYGDMGSAVNGARECIKSLPSAEPERHYCRECKWSQCHINLDKYGRSESYWHCLNWDGGTDEEGFCHEWERRTQ